MRSTTHRSSRQVQSRLTVHALGGLLLILAAAIFLLYSGLRMVPASVNYFQSQLFISDWVKQKQQPSAAAFAIAHNAALKSVALYPVDHGRYYTRLGHVLQWQDFAKPFGDPSARASRLEALYAHKEAVKARPTWPYAYIDTAWTKLYLLEIDDEFHQALADALKYGGTRLGIHYNLAEISLLAWTRLTDEQRQRGLHSAQQTVKLSPKQGIQLLNTAKQNGLIAEFCHAIPATHWGHHKVCLEKDA